MTFRFVIPRLTPTNNVLLRTHWRERKRLVEEWFWELKMATQALEIPRPAFGESRRLALISRRCQLADEDNFRGGLKPLLDAMTAAELLFDDGPKFLRLQAAQVKVRRRAEERTELRLTITRPKQSKEGGLS